MSEAVPVIVPVVVLGGWLGSGKTTLVNHLLRHAGGRRVAVLVNDFGEVSIDADLIEGAAEGVLALAGGCVCCSFGADLVGTLARAVALRPDVVLLECSGVGLPRAVARSAALVAGARVDGVVVVADAVGVREQSADAYVGDVVRQQLQEADLLLLNKADRVDDSALEDLQRWLGGFAPVLATKHAQVDPAVVLGVQSRPGGNAFVARPMPRPAAARFDSTAITVAQPVDVERLAARLAAQPGLLRAKGVLRGADGRPCVLHVVGRRWSVEPAREGAVEARLAVITLPGQAGAALAAVDAAGVPTLNCPAPFQEDR